MHASLGICVQEARYSEKHSYSYHCGNGPLALVTMSCFGCEERRRKKEEERERREMGRISNRNINAEIWRDRRDYRSTYRFLLLGNYIMYKVEVG